MKVPTKSDALQSIRTAPKRLALGIAIMVMSSVIGGLLLSQEKSTVVAYRLVDSVAAGTKLEPGLAEQVLLPAKLADAQWISAEQLQGVRASHDLLAGDLIRASDVTTQTSGLSVVTFTSDAGDVPHVTVGGHVQLWAASLSGVEQLSQGRVIARAEDAQGRISLSVAVPPAEVAGLIGAIDAGKVRAVVPQ